MILIHYIHYNSWLFKVQKLLHSDLFFQISLIQDKKASLSGRQQTLTHLKNVTTTSLERARHASLLTELVSGGLCRKLKEVTSTSTQSETVCVKKPELKRTAAHVSEKSESVGEIVYRTENMSVKDGVNKKTGIRHFAGNYKEVFKKTLKQTLEIKINDWCKKVSVFDDKVWVPVFNNKVVNVYTVSGELVNTFRTQGCPVSVEKTATGEIMVLCYNTGLYVLNKDTNNTVRISAGDYCDMCVCGESVYTWDCRKKCVEKFVKDDTGTWRQNRVVSVTWIQNRHYWDTLLVREGEDDTSVEFFIGVCYQHTVFQVNSQGDKVRQFGGQNEQGDGGLKCPCVCGVDNHGHVLVADMGHNQYKLLDTHTGHWSVVFTGESEVDDAKITGNTIWFSRHTNSGHVITKHEISM